MVVDMTQRETQIWILKLSNHYNNEDSCQIQMIWAEKKLFIA